MDSKQAVQQQKENIMTNNTFVIALAVVMGIAKYGVIAAYLYL